ncbi:hypothetical protein [Providencia stuartii]|uniref:hypothetical protein n=1 Tax=Providencia stuartii TaxID=588 RepID=UPI0038304DCA
MTEDLNRNSASNTQNQMKKLVLLTVNGRINFLSGGEALDKPRASEKRLVEAPGYQGQPPEYATATNGKMSPFCPRLSAVDVVPLFFGATSKIILNVIISHTENHQKSY